jgi:topoisomerase-4 subunit A
MPYQVQKSRLIESLAELIEQKKAPLLGDVRDESAEDIRLVIEPKNRTIDAEVLMESLFKLSDLEVRFPINMNVLDATGTPRVMGLKACLQAFPRPPPRRPDPPRPMADRTRREATAPVGRPAGSSS